MQKTKRRTVLIFDLKKVLACVLCIIVSFCAIPIAVAVQKQGGECIVVDAGHGGEDAGVCGVRTGVQEKTINLQIARLLCERLESAGYRVVMTRTSDVRLRFDKDVGSKKRGDMFKRAQIISNANPLVVVSIHSNFYSSSARRGAQVFFARHKQNSIELANAVQDRLNEQINSCGVGRNLSALSAEKFLLDCHSCASIIVECGFLSNPIDEANLTNVTHQALLANAVCEGVLQYIQMLQSSKSPLDEGQN